MLNKRSIVPLFWILKFYYYISKRLLCFHIIISNSNCSQKDIGINFYCRAPFQFNDYPSNKHNMKKVVIMMFPMHQILMMIESTHAVGSLNWKNGRSVITIVRMSYSPTDDSYLSLRQLSVIFVIKIVFLQLISFYTRNMFIYVCLFLSHFSFYLYYSFLFTDAHY